jgi:hypothetical protein
VGNKKKHKKSDEDQLFKYSIKLNYLAFISDPFWEISF